MAVAHTQKRGRRSRRRAGAFEKAREMMEQLNTDAAKSFVWVRTQMNSPAQRPWFTDSGGESGAGQMASGRVAANQLKTAAYRWRWKEYKNSRKVCIRSRSARSGSRRFCYKCPTFRRDSGFR